MTRSRGTLWRFLLLGLIVVAGVAGLLFLPLRDWLAPFRAWMQGLGIWGLVLLAAAFIPACLLMLPGALITLGAGAAFDFVPAVVAISLGSTTGAACAFVVGRTLARPWVESKVQGNPRFPVDRAIGEQGFKIVFLLRLSPIFPFNVLNYALALTRVSFRDYVLASWIGMLPGTILYVYLGSAAQQAVETAAGREQPLEQQIAFWAGLAVTLLATIYVSWVAKRALDRALTPAKPPLPGNDDMLIPNKERVK
jgi:uncharacterized membrane protein YdjX (TVP38/TMEM64 family)